MGVKCDASAAVNGTHAACANNPVMVVLLGVVVLVVMILVVVVVVVVTVVMVVLVVVVVVMLVFVGIKIVMVKICMRFICRANITRRTRWVGHFNVSTTALGTAANICGVGGHTGVRPSPFRLKIFVVAYLKIVITRSITCRTAFRLLGGFS